MAVTIVYGGQELTLPRLVGETVADVREDDSLSDVLGLQGGENFEVRQSGGSFRGVSNTYVFSDGDTVRISRPSGTKG